MFPCVTIINPIPREALWYPLSYPFPHWQLMGSQLSTGCPLYSIGNNGFPHRSPWKPWDLTQTSSLSWHKFPCCLWRIAKNVRHRRKVKGIFLTAQPHFHADLVTWLIMWRPVTKWAFLKDINENIDLHEGLKSLVLFWCYFPVINEVTRCFI